MDRPIGAQHQRDFDQSESLACSSAASCQLSAVKCGIINKTGACSNKIQEEEEQEEKQEEEQHEEQEQQEKEEDGDDVGRSPRLNLVIRASGLGWEEGDTGRLGLRFF